MRTIEQKPENQALYTVIHSFHDQEHYNGVYATSMAEAILISQSQYGGRVIIAKEAWLVPDSDGVCPDGFDKARVERILDTQYSEAEYLQDYFDWEEKFEWPKLDDEEEQNRR